MFEIVADIFIMLFRYITWMAASMVMTLTNVILEVFQLLITLDIFQAYPYIWVIYTGFMGVSLVFFIIYRIGKMHLKTLADVNGGEQVYHRGSDTIKKIFIILLVAGFIPIFFKAYSSFAAEVATRLPKILGFGETLKLNDVFCSISKNGCPTSSANFIDGAILTKEAGEYKYFPNTLDLILLTIGSWMALRLLVIICMSVVSRLIGVLFRMPLAPYVISSYLEEGDTKLKTWVSFTFSDLSVNFLQMLLVILAFHFIGSAVLDSLTSSMSVSDLTVFIAKIFIVIGSLMAIVNAPGNIAQLIGSDASAITSMQQAGFTNNLIKEGAGNVKTMGAVAAMATLGASDYLNTKVKQKTGSTIGQHGSHLLSQGLGAIGNHFNLSPTNQATTANPTMGTRAGQLAKSFTKSVGRATKRGIAGLGNATIDMSANHLNQKARSIGLNTSFGRSKR